MSMPSAADAAGVEEFYKGRSVSLIIGFSAGSGYDIYARLLARFIGRYIPGNPTIVPQNMPGAGSQGRACTSTRVAPKDGSVIGTMSRSLPIEPLLGDAKFDGRSFTWIGNIANNNSLCAMWHTIGIKTWQDVMTKPFVLGGAGTRLRPRHVRARILKNVFGAKVKIVSGYPGGNEVNLAMERREIDGRCGWSWDSIRSTRPDWLRDKKINLLRCSRWSGRRNSGRGSARSEISRATTSSGRFCACIWPGRRSAGRSSPRPAFRRTARRRCARPSTPP